MVGERGPVTVGERALSAARAAALGTAADPTLSHRYFLWRVAWQLILAEPVGGVGHGRFVDHVARVAEDLGDTAREPARTWIRHGARHAHNEFLNAWAEGGVFTVLGLVGMAASVLLRLRRDGAADLPQATATGSLVAVFVHGLVSYPLQQPMTAMVFWIILGITNTNYSRALEPHETS